MEIIFSFLLQTMNNRDDSSDIPEFGTADVQAHPPNNVGVPEISISPDQATIGVPSVPKGVFET